MRLDRRTVALIFLVATLVATTLLSVGLSGLALQPGRPLPYFRVSIPARDSSGPMPGGDFLLSLTRIAYLIGAILLPFALLYFIFSAKARRQLIKELKRLLPPLIAFYLIARLLPAFALRFEELRSGGAAPLGEEAPPQEAVIPSVANPPEWLVLATSLGLALLIAALVGAAARTLWLRRRDTSGRPEGMVRPPETAPQSSEAEADLSNPVIRCYSEMLRVVGERRGIRRDKTMTARELELILEAGRLPHQPVRQLTRLFEAARYGARAPGEQEERQAAESLDAVIAACLDPDRGS